MEFIRRFLQHVLPSGFVKVRHYGLHHPSVVSPPRSSARRCACARRSAARSSSTPRTQALSVPDLSNPYGETSNADPGTHHSGPRPRAGEARKKRLKSIRKNDEILAEGRSVLSCRKNSPGSSESARIRSVLVVKEEFVVTQRLARHMSIEPSGTHAPKQNT